MEQPKTLADIVKTAEDLGASCLPFAYLQDRSGKESLPALPLLPLDTLGARMQATYPATELTVRIRAVGSPGWACQAQHNTGMPAPATHAAPAPATPAAGVQFLTTGTHSVPVPVDEIATLRAQVAALQAAAATPQTVSVMPSSPLNGAMEILNVASALAMKLNPPPPPAPDALAELDRIEKIAARIGAGKTEKVQLWETLGPAGLALADRFLSTVESAFKARSQPAPQAPAPSSDQAPPQTTTALLDTGVVSGRPSIPAEPPAAPTEPPAAAGEEERAA